MKIFITLGDIVGIIILGIVIIFGIFYILVNEIKKIGKKNCYKCKYYELYNVASCGDGCWYKCIKYDRKDNCVSMNETEHYEKCKYYKEEKNNEISNK